MDLWKQINSENRSRRNAAVFRTSCLLIIVLSLPAICYLTLNKLAVPDNELVFTNSPHEGSERSGSIEIVRGEETQSESESSGTENGIPVKDNLPRINFTKIEDPTPSFEKYAYISGDLVMDEDGIIRVKKDAIGSKNIQRHSIESEHIDGSSITSGKIKNNSILGKDINRETKITVAKVIADDFTAQNLVIAESIDLGTNEISDGMFTGDWNFGSGDITTSGTISGTFAGSFAPSGDVDMTNHIFTNIGNAGTDFDSSGGLNLAGNLVAGGSLSGTALNTGQGNYELYAMDQNVLTSSSPTFSGIILSGDLNLGTNTITISHTTLISNLNADYLDGNDSSYFLNTSTNFGGDVSGTYNAIAVSDDSHSHTALTLPALTSYLGSSIESSEITDNTITTSDLSLSLDLLSGQSLDYGLGTLTANALNSALTYGVSISGNAATVTDGIYTTTGFGGDASGTYNNLQISGLVAADFTSQNISQWSNNSNYITASETITGLVQSTATGNSWFTGGNVGIGTTSPTQKLDVAGNINTSGDITITNSDPTVIFASTTVGVSTGVLHQSGNILSLGTLGLSDMFSLDLATGYVGIGTTAPLASLDVNGDLRLSPQTTAPEAQEGKVYYDANDKSYKLYNTQETVAGEYIDLVADPHIQPTECPTGYVSVPGDARYGTAGGFCVMKYEAKCAATADPTTGLTSPDTGYQTYANNTTACTSANSKQVVSTASGYPIANISQTDAKTYCSALGTGYHLITNSEWMTIARNIEKRGENWTSSTVGTNGLYRGHSDNTPTTALAANSDDSEGYEGTGNSSPSQEKRTFTLSNGEVIWDLSGNVYEWNQDTIKRKDEPHSTTAPDNTFGWKEFTTVDDYGTMSYASMRPSNPNWNATQNMGRLYTYNPNGDTNTTQYAFLRSGYWIDTSNAGLFTLNLNGTPGSTLNGIGLRCVFTP